jgi:hypothetical protein
MGGALLSFSLMAVAVLLLGERLNRLADLPWIVAVGVALYCEPLELSILVGAAVIFSGTY